MESGRALVNTGENFDFLSDKINKVFCTNACQIKIPNLIHNRVCLDWYLANTLKQFKRLNIVCFSIRFIISILWLW